MRETGEKRALNGPETTRRGFLKAGGLGALGLTLAESAAASDNPQREGAVILLMLVGGPSQLETWDPKPDAPAEVRGPFGSIATEVPGIRIGEHLPGLARRMDRLTLIRSLHHDAAPIHETGQQLIQTGRLCRLGQEYPHAGSVVARLGGARQGLPPFVVLPNPIGNTGVDVPHGQSAGALGPACAPFVVRADPAAADFDAGALSRRARRFFDAGPGTLAGLRNCLESRPHRAFDVRSERDALRDAYGRNTFGQSCLLARRLVEAGVRLVTINMYESVFNRVTWDCHGGRPFSTLDDYAADVLPTFDRALSALLDDLGSRGLLESTLVVATGEFGRTPRLNPAGGRDHWPGAWSAMLAGGGTRGGQVIGATDAHASCPVDRPVQPAEILATMYRCLGVDPGASVDLGESGTLALVEDAPPIAEAFA